MPAQDLPRIDINSAGVGQLTQLPGIAKNTAYKIVNHRQRHGLFTSWEELTGVKTFPTERLAEIKGRAELKVPEDARPARGVKRAHLERMRKKPGGYTKAMRSGRRPGKMHDSSIHRPH
ncbi:MAG: helix-hairpin-helix domain-containing protein [Acidobacteriales bacterium]|nr:helix-hairpin-helix domain-containing protein [Terriglobales bacterium]